MKRQPITTIATPATLLRVGWLSNRKSPTAVAVRPSVTKMRENVVTKTRLRKITLGSMRRPGAPGATPDTVAR
jgi:hypothetical protein